MKLHQTVATAGAKIFWDNLKSYINLADLAQLGSLQLSTT